MDALRTKERQARHSIAENIRDAKRFVDNPSLSDPDTVGDVYDPGLEDFLNIQAEITTSIGDGCTRRSPTQVW